MIPEEYAVEYVVDRVDTTATVWLGLTAGCARCHDHKYDPISQKEFYQLYSYFNNVPERGKAIKYGNSPPFIKSPTREQQKKLTNLQEKLRLARERFEGLQPELNQVQAVWERSNKPHTLSSWCFTRHRTAFWRTQDEVQKYPLAGDTSAIGAFGFFDKFSMGARIQPEGKQGGVILSRTADIDRGEGYRLLLENGKIHVQLVKRWLDDAIRIETEQALATGRKHHVFFTYDGSREAQGIKIYLDGQPARVKVNLDDLNQNFATSEPFRIGAGGAARFQGKIEEVTIFDEAISPADVAVVASTDSLQAIAALQPQERTAAQRRHLRTAYLENDAPTEFREAYLDYLGAAETLEKFDASLPTTMVMQEMASPRPTYLLLRGEYDKQGPRVFAAVPAVFPPLPKGVSNNRLGLAKWLMAPEHPLTARVAVNRHWQMLFGAGLVKTVEDFGAQGDWPSHPELLDWLAVEFRAGGWNVKELLKTIVTSATYRQSSRIPPELLQRDPENRLLARGPRFRLSADMIRDQALFASGLLIEKIGGPSVRPYQPAGLVKELHGTEDYVQDHGANLYRRSMYTFWKRTVAPPTLMTFDAANRETCVVRETRTNTPLQALNLMNDVTFVEAARVLAQRVLKETGPGEDARLIRAYQRATARQPHADELRILRAALAQHRRQFADHKEAALKLIRTGEAPHDPALDPVEHAAFAAVCNLILNLDEVITKE